MSPRRELLAFAIVLGAVVSGFFGPSLFGGRVLSPADNLLVSASIGGASGPVYEPANRLLMDPVLQFQPWIEFNRSMVRQGRLPLWNEHAGCGAPHLANGQSAVFDPFQLIAYAGSVPSAYAWMAAARLWVAGVGMFLLARGWGLACWGRWFAGMAFPFCGFLVVWLLYPVTNVAIWMPWIFLTSDRVLHRRTIRSVGGLALASALVLVGGHIQTSAHVLLAAGLYVAWRVVLDPGKRSPAAGDGAERPGRLAPLAAWGAGIALGVSVAAVEVVPLGVYLTKSPVWEDRTRERPSPWTIARPRLLGAVCTALPYAFGSQRRGHPHLSRALGVHNLNEAAGGFAGLATLVWLAPLGWSLGRRDSRVRFLGVLAVFGAMGAFGLPPVDNILRALPVLGVTDNRRLTLWVAFALVILGAMGLDGVPRSRWTRGPRLWVGLALVLLSAAATIGRAAPLVRERAFAHYARAAAETAAADAAAYRVRADRQVHATLEFMPRYLGLAGAYLLALAALARAIGRRSLPGPAVQAALLGLTMVDLLGFGFELNPSIRERDDRPEGPLIAYLRREVAPPFRMVGLGQELPPNTAMRYGLSDLRNYDSVELARSLEWFAPLYEPGGKARTSRREVTWDGVLRARERLEAASVAAVVAPSPPPAGSFGRVDRVGSVWVARLGPSPWAELESGRVRVVSRASGTIALDCESVRNQHVIIKETYDSGWRGELDGRAVAVGDFRGTFLAVPVPAGRHRLVLVYDPIEVRIACGVSLFALCAVLFALTLPGSFRSTRIMAGGLGRTQAVELESVM